MHEMRQISCPMCGRSVTVSTSGPVPCPSCGVPVSAPAAAEPPVSPALADDASATRIATIPPSEQAPVSAPPAVVPAAIPASAPVAPASDITDPRTQPVSEAEVRQAALPPVGVESGAAAAAAVTPASAQPPTQTYHGTPQQDPTTQTYQNVAQPQPGQVAPKRNPALLVVGAVVAVVLLLAIIGAAVVFANRASQKTVATPTPTATITATATANVPPGFTQFADDGKVYTIDYPSGWTKTATSGDFSLTMFSGAPAHVPAVFEVEYVKMTLDPTTLQDQFFKGLALTGKVTDKQGPTAVTLAGETWQRETADVTMGQTAQHVVVMATNHGQYSVLIAYLVAKTSFDTTDTQDFQPMLNSFQFVP